MTRDYYSFSQLKTASECGLKYHNKYVLGEERRRDTLEQVAGTILHSVYEHVDKGDMGAGDTFGFARDSLQNHEGFKGLPHSSPTRDWSWWLSEGFPTHINNFLDFRDQERATGFSWFRGDPKQSLELELSVEVGLEFPVYGIIDRIHYDSDGVLVVRDYKTGAPRPTDGIQSDVYAVMVEEETGEEVGYSEIVYTRGKEATVDTVQRNLDFLGLTKLFAGLEEARYSTPLVQGPFTGACDTCEYTDCSFRRLGERNTVALPDLVEIR